MARSAHRSATPRRTRSTWPAGRPRSSSSVLGAQASAWQTTSRSTDGASRSSASRSDSAAHATRVSTVQEKGQSVTGSRSCRSRSPDPIARAATRGRRSQYGSTADRLDRATVRSHEPSSSAPTSRTTGTRTKRPAHRIRSASAPRSSSGWCGAHFTNCRAVGYANVIPPSWFSQTAWAAPSRSRVAMARTARGGSSAAAGVLSGSHRVQSLACDEPPVEIGQDPGQGVPVDLVRLGEPDAALAAADVSELGGVLLRDVLPVLEGAQIETDVALLRGQGHHRPVDRLLHRLALIRLLAIAQHRPHGLGQHRRYGGGGVGG